MTEHQYVTQLLRIFCLLFTQAWLTGVWMRVNCITLCQTALTAVLTSFCKRRPWVLWVATSVSGLIQGRGVQPLWTEPWTRHVTFGSIRFCWGLQNNFTLSLLHQVFRNRKTIMSPKSLISVSHRVHLRSLGCLSERSIRTSKEQTRSAQTVKALLHPVLCHHRYVCHMAH